MKSKLWSRVRRYYKQRHLIVAMLRARLGKSLVRGRTPGLAVLGGNRPTDRAGWLRLIDFVRKI